MKRWGVGGGGDEESWWRKGGSGATDTSWGWGCYRKNTNISSRTTNGQHVNLQQFLRFNCNASSVRQYHNINNYQKNKQECPCTPTPPTHINKTKNTDKKTVMKHHCKKSQDRLYNDVQPEMWATTVIRHYQSSLHTSNPATHYIIIVWLEPISPNPAGDSIAVNTATVNQYCSWHHDSQPIHADWRFHWVSKD